MLSVKLAVRGINTGTKSLPCNWIGQNAAIWQIALEALNRFFLSDYFFNYKIPPSGIEPEFSAPEADALSFTPRGPGTAWLSLAFAITVTQRKQLPPI